MFGDGAGGDAGGMGSSSSPIQRTVTAIDGVEVLQEITLDGPDPRVDQMVLAGNAGTLR